MSSAIPTQPNGKDEPQKPKLKTFRKDQTWYRYICTWRHPMLFPGRLPKRLKKRPARIPHHKCGQSIEHFSRPVLDHLFEGHWNRHIKEQKLLDQLQNGKAN